jgi:Zn-dependent protease with chaperone function/ribosomal protein S27E
VDTRIHPDEYRVVGEKTALYWGFGSLAFVILFITALNVGLFALAVVALAGGWVWVRQGQLLGACVKVSEQQFPAIQAIAERAARRLAMQMPEVFVEYSPVLNAYALGFLGKKSVVVHSATIEAMTDLELEFIIGHEFSHIKCGHTNLTVLTSSQSSVSVPGVSQFLTFVFLFWQRKAEYTCDRGGLLANRNPRSAMSAMCKLAVGPTLFKQMNIDHFLGQQMAIEQSDVSKLSETLATHPYLVKRIHALRDFFFSAEYDRIVSRIDGQAADISEDSHSSHKILACPKCAQKLRVPSRKTLNIKCSKCGTSFLTST